MQRTKTTLLNELEKQNAMQNPYKYLTDVAFSLSAIDLRMFTYDRMQPITIVADFII